MGLWRTRWFDPVLDTYPRRKSLDTVAASGSVLFVVGVESPFGPASYAVMILIEGADGSPVGVIERAVVGKPAPGKPIPPPGQSGANRATRQLPDDNGEDEA